MEQEIADSTLDALENAATATTDRSPMLEISNAMVRLYKEAFGRGPTKARAQLAAHDTLVVILENSLTVGERNLVAMGEPDLARDAQMDAPKAHRVDVAGEGHAFCQLRWNEVLLTRRRRIA